MAVECQECRQFLIHAVFNLKCKNVTRSDYFHGQCMFAEKVPYTWGEKNYSKILLFVTLLPIKSCVEGGFFEKFIGLFLFLNRGVFGRTQSFDS